MKTIQIDKMRTAVLVCLVASLAGTVLFGETSAITPQPSDIPAVGTGVIDALKNAIGFAVPEWILAIGSFVMVEIVGRIWKTTKPWSVLYFLRDFCIYVSMLLNAVSGLLDRLLQRTKEKGATNPPPQV